MVVLLRYVSSLSWFTAYCTFVRSCHNSFPSLSLHCCGKTCVFVMKGYFKLRIKKKEEFVVKTNCLRALLILIPYYICFTICQSSGAFVQILPWSSLCSSLLSIEKGVILFPTEVISAHDRFLS